MRKHIPAGGGCALAVLLGVLSWAALIWVVRTWACR
jgi:hypothetical protein